MHNKNNLLNAVLKINFSNWFSNKGKHTKCKTIIYWDKLLKLEMGGGESK